MTLHSDYYVLCKFIVCGGDMNNYIFLLVKTEKKEEEKC